MPNMKQDPKSGGLIFDLTEEESLILKSHKDVRELKSEWESKRKELDEKLKIVEELIQDRR